MAYVLVISRYRVINEQKNSFRGFNFVKEFFGRFPLNHKSGDQVKKIIRYNLLITIIQFLIFAILLFAAFFLKFNIDRQVNDNTEHGFVIKKIE